MDKYMLQLRMNEFLIIYLRKSRQDNEYESIEEVLNRHEKQLQEFAVRLIGKRIEEQHVFREIVSGETIRDRPMMKEVLKTIENPLCKGVIVIEPQRLTRGDLIDLGNIIYAFQYSNTLILTPTKTFNLENKYDREYFERELLRGKDYIEYTKEILMRGRSASAHEGNYVSSIAPYGYDRVKIDKNWILVPNNEEKEMVRLMFHLYANEGLGANLIAQKLNELGAKPRKAKRFTPTAIRQILTNEVYLGMIRWNAKPVIKVLEDGKIVKKRTRNKNYELIKGKHQAIIDEDLFMKAQERKQNNTSERVEYDLRNIYSGLLKCKKCGGAMALRPYKTRKERYYCRSGVYCNNKGSNVDVVNGAILLTLKAHLEDFKVKLDENNKHQFDFYEKMLAKLENDLKLLEDKQESLYDFLEKGIYTKEVFLARNEKLAQEREELQEKIKKVRLDKPNFEKNQQQYYSLFECINAIDDPRISAKVKNQLLKNIVEVIYYEKDESDSPTGSTLENAKFKLEVILK